MSELTPPRNEPAPANAPPHPSDGPASSGLIYLVKDAVNAVDWPNKQKNFSLGPEQTFPSAQLMTLEVYCYARGVYNSEEVERAIRSDPPLQELFPENWPDRRSIKRFRRYHREPIKQCLLHVFHRAFFARFGDPAGELAPVDSCVALALDKWFEPICGPQPDSEANERIDRAILWDGILPPE